MFKLYFFETIHKSKHKNGEKIGGPCAFFQDMGQKRDTGAYIFSERMGYAEKINKLKYVVIHYDSDCSIAALVYL